MRPHFSEQKDISCFRPRSPRVLVIQKIVPPYRVPLFSALRSTFPRFAVIATSPHDSNYLPHLRNHDIPWLLSNPHLVSPNLRRLYRFASQQADVVVVPLEVRSIVSWSFLLRRRRPAIVLWGHGYPSTKPRTTRSKLIFHIYRLMASLSDGVITYSARGKDLLSPVPGNPVIAAAPNTVAVSVENIPSSQQEHLECKYSLYGWRDPTFLFVGRLTSRKFPDITVRVSRYLRSMGYKHHLVIIGDGPELPRVKSLAATEPQITFLGECWEQQSVERYLVAADALFIPGAVGLSLVSALGCGTAVVTRKINWEAEYPLPEYDYLEHGRNSVLVEGLDVPRMAAAILDYHGEWWQLGRYAREYFLSHCQLPNFVAGYQYVITEAARRPHRRRSPASPRTKGTS